MKKSLMVVLFLAACGGSHKTAPQPAEPAPAPAAAEPAPAPEAAPAPAPEAKEAKPADTGEAAAAAAQAQLAEQYDKGKKLYTEKKCVTCHGDHGEGNKKNPPVIGEKALPEKAPAGAKLRKGVTFKTAKDVVEFVKAKMPVKKPGTLTDDEAAAVTAWILSESKVAIDKPLDMSNADSVKLH